MYYYDYLIIGAGIIGLGIARELKIKYPEAAIAVIDKEPDIAYHSSGRNSGVLHAGFYYNTDSLKARFTKEGNAELQKYCQKNKLKINPCGKVVVTGNEEELEALYELERRGKANGVDVSLIDEKALSEIEPNAVTVSRALYSPTTATVDPVEICHFIRKELKNSGVSFYFSECYVKRRKDDEVVTSSGKVFVADKIINAAGLYADRIAKDYGFSSAYTIIPFKGLYLKYTGEGQPIKTNIYPVPNLKNPFLGVHFTITVDNTIKIGPTSMPALWRENYKGLDHFSIKELAQILGWESRLFLKNAFGFRDLAKEEIRKYKKSYFVNLASRMVHQINTKKFNAWSKPGIRAQLLNKKTLELVQDFVVEGDKQSVHVLNAVSPAFTSSFSFARWIVENYI
jgi:(S)-2-hydroxyglutarate dehydrogenase